MLAPGQRVENTHDLAGAYKFTLAGEGTYNFKLAGRLATSDEYALAPSKREVSYAGCNEKQKAGILAAAMQVLNVPFYTSFSHIRSAEPPTRMWLK
ncbi:hypothetical protein FRC10_003918 [Ceratobasidium sp. 414]|nr:hypothetical protein FRC10_003918 [Ceratobasidium sp. 414]